MWAILIGFAFGAIAYFLAAWISNELTPLYQLITDPLSSGWLRVGLIGLVVITSTMWIGGLFVIAHIWPPATAAFDLHQGWDFFWVLFHGTRFGSACVGFALGLATVAWGAHASQENAANVGLLGTVLAVAAAIVALVAVDHDLNFLGRLSKVSTSFVSFELESARGKGSRASNRPSDALGTTWTASEPVNTALIVLEDLASNAVRRDDAVVAFTTDAAGPVHDDDEEIPKQRLLFENVLQPLVVLRRAIHAEKRDASAGFFYTEKQELVGLAVALRDLVLFDLRTETLREPERQAKISVIVGALAAVVRRSRTEVCDLELWRQSNSKPDQVAAIEKAATCRDIEHGLKDLQSWLPGRVAVRKTPYFAIMAAATLFGSGEREAAAVILDQWRHQVPDKQMKSSPQASKYRDKIAAVHDVRVVNLIGMILPDSQNVVLIELATHYQWSAMKLSDEVIGSYSKLSDFMGKMRAAKNEPGLIAVASEFLANRKTNCPDTKDITHDVAYFVYRRASQLNNAIFYLTMQSNILEPDTTSAQLEEWMNALEATKQDCLGVAIGQSAEEVKARLASVVDTLAHGYLALAALRKADSSRSRKALCRAYRAAYIADKLAGSPQHLDLSNHRAFLSLSLFQNGTNISSFDFKNAARQNLRSTRDQIEAVGEGACADVMSGKLNSWADED